MPSRHSQLKSLLSLFTLALAFSLTPATANAQTVAAEVATTKAEAVKTETTPAEPSSTPATAPAAEAKDASVTPKTADALTVPSEPESSKSGDAPAEAAPAKTADPPPPAAALTTSTPAAATSAAPAAAPAVAATACKRTITADVVAIAQPYMLNRLGASMPNALVFVLRGDVMGSTPTDIQLRPWKRARPIVLRANEGDCLQITLTSLINSATASSSTPPVSIHAQGMQTVKSIADDGSFVGLNASSLADPSVSLADPTNKKKVYNLYAQHEGTFLLYSEGDSSTTGQQLFQGLFGAVNVEPADAEWYRSQVTKEDMQLAIDHTKGNNGLTPAKQPIINYNALYPANYPDASRACTPILKMADFTYKPSPDGKSCQQVDKQLKLYHTDLTAVITGKGAGRFAGTTGAGPTAAPEPECNKPVPAGKPFNPLFCRQPALPDRKQPYREVTIIYHEVFPSANQAFNAFWDSTNPLLNTVRAGRDDFAINYGTGGIGAEIYANRIGVGPMANCTDCKYEEFFLTSWAVGDPAMVVDVPANFTPFPPPPPCQYNQLKPSDTFTPCISRPTQDPTGSALGYKATKAFYPDDPSNVYHSYLNDHVKFRILHGGTGVTHVHHQHAHQWIQSPNSSEGSYLDSQFISPGASYTLEMVYNGSGNRNKTLGDSIFHCHFYPHFAEGMWAMWRVHDVFEAGTEMDSNGRPVLGSRAYPDAEIKAGTPIPALIPMPTMPMPLVPSPVFIQNGQVVYGTTAAPDPTGVNVKENPGFPFFVPGIAGFRPPHPPLDFAPDDANPGQLLDGGLPRHVNTGGTTTEKQTTTDWSKDFVTLNTKQLPEDGTSVEKVTIAFNSQRCRPTFMPDGSANNPFGALMYPLPECANQTSAFFILNGLPNGPQRGAPFADPAIDDRGKPVGTKRTYKAAALQIDAKFNKQGWHYSQQRLLTLWQDVTPTASGARPPEPFFFRANSEDDYIEYWHTNLVPNYYEVDAFQVRTPTDILGQHIHLVKFDVTSSDGAANGWNYEDGTLSPQEVQEIHHAIKNGGSWQHCAGCTTDLRPPQPPPSLICSGTPLPSQCKQSSAVNWFGAQTTIQRWYADPFRDNDGQDNTVRTVFTHDHFGPSTHQQAGLYAGLLVEPKGSKWRNPETGAFFGGAGVPGRPDGGPTSWRADIITTPVADSYREFALEFQDFTLAYAANPNLAINPPPVPTLISTGGQPAPGTLSVNYLNAPFPFRTQGGCQDLAYVFDSDCVQATSAATGNKLTGDPETPILRMYENDKVQIRNLVGAHTFSHYFTIGGPRWLFEPSWSNSGFRSSQGMGISEHFEMLFTAPPSSVGKARTKCPEGKYPNAGDCVDYLYSPSNDDFGMVNGMWGIMRAYDPTKPFDELKPMPNNPLGPGTTLGFQACPANQPANKKRTYNITAIDAESFLSNGAITFNSRLPNLQSLGLMYVFSEDIDPATKKLKGPVEPLILRANAGDCITVNLTNAINTNSAPFTPRNWPQPFNNSIYGTVTSSKYVGIQPQLLSFDGATSGGINVGYNAKPQAVAKGEPPITYNWYAGDISRNQTGALTFTPIEFGSLNLTPTDPLMQHQWALFGGMVIEPAGSTWKCDALDANGKTISVPCEPGSPGYNPSAKGFTRASATVTAGSSFREFVAMVNEDLILNAENRSAINYRTEPQPYRYGNTDAEPQNFAANGNNTCATSNALVLFGSNPSVQIGDPQTPIFTAKVGTPVRFRLMHPQGTGTAQVFTVNGHVWQREPYINGSTSIGDNVLSQWLGSHDSHGATDHYDLVIAKAGGQNSIPGDYLYTTFVPNQNALGSWGIFRVLDANGNKVDGNPVCNPSNTRPAPPKGRDPNDFIRPPFEKTIKQQ